MTAKQIEFIGTNWYFRSYLLYATTISTNIQYYSKSQKSFSWYVFPWSLPRSKIRSLSYRHDSRLSLFRYMGIILVILLRHSYKNSSIIHMCLGVQRYLLNTNNSLNRYAEHALRPIAIKWKSMCCPQPTFIMSNAQAIASMAGIQSLCNFLRITLAPIHRKTRY